MARVPGTLTCLFYFAVLGWSHHRVLGQLSPPTQSLLRPDQVGPWPTGHDPLPVSCPDTMGMGSPMPLLASPQQGGAASLCPGALPKAPPDLFQTGLNLSLATGLLIPPRDMSPAAFPPSPPRFTPYLASMSPDFRTRQGFIQVGNEGYKEAKASATSLLS